MSEKMKSPEVQHATDQTITKISKIFSGLCNVLELVVMIWIVHDVLADIHNLPVNAPMPARDSFMSMIVVVLSILFLLQFLFTTGMFDHIGTKTYNTEEVSTSSE